MQSQSTESEPHRRLINAPKVALLLLILPAGLLLLSIIETNAAGPFYLLGNFDPAYCYLLNSLNILTFHIPGHTDHPGTTLQVFGAVIVLIKWLSGAFFGAWQPLQRGVLSNPESYLHAINLTLCLLISTTVYVVARRVYSISGSLLMALALQISFLFFRQTVAVPALVQPEPLLLVAGLALAIPMTQVLFAQKSDPAVLEKRASIAAGAIFAFGMVSKITFVSLLPLMVVFNRRASRVRFILTTIATSTVLLLPVLPRVPLMAQWFTTLFTHTGRYGGGETGIVNRAVFLPALYRLMREEPAPLVMTGYFIVALLVLTLGGAKDRFRDPIVKLLAGVCLTILTMVFLIARGAGPVHYLVPVMVAEILVTTMLVGALERGKYRRWVAAPLLILLAGFALWAVNRTRVATDLGIQYGQRVRDDADALTRRRQSMPGCTYVGYYRSSLMTYALSFGNDFSAGQQAPVMAGLYPDAVSFDIFSGQWKSFAGRIPAGEVRRWLRDGRCIVMEGAVPGGVASVGLQFQDQMIGMKMEPILIAGPEGLYKLTLGSAADQPGELIPGREAPPDSIIVEGENFSSGTVVVDRSYFGPGIGVVVAPKVPAYAEYKIIVPRAGRYEFRIRYASAEERPLRALLNGRVISKLAASEATTGYFPKDQLWQKVGVFDFYQGENTLRLESQTFFPHVDKLAIVPVKTP